MSADFFLPSRQLSEQARALAHAAAGVQHTPGCMFLLGPRILAAAASLTWPHSGHTSLVTRSRAFCAVQPAQFSQSAWEQTQFDDLSDFERITVAASLLDDADVEVVNHAMWRGLRYTVDDQGRLLDADGQLRDDPPDFMNDSAALAKLEAMLPLDEEEAMDGLESFVEALHGESITRLKIKEGSADFNVRRLVVCCLHYYGFL